ncbi:hypothetical protein ORI99_01850 [Alishewanella sp. SMS9]|nr:hypothetical protein [Alishewanella sp. SMS9]
MLMQTKSITDRSLLLAVGFFNDTGVDVRRLALFCGVSERTAYRWLSDGLPARTRHLLECLLAGDFLPPEWRRMGLKVSCDKLYLQSGHSIPLKALTRWPFICQAVDWSKVPD